MNTVALRLIPVLLTCIALLVQCTPKSTEPDAHHPPSDGKPNVLLVLTDDQGWGDLGFNGNPLLDTPSLDHLFEQAVVFERFYVSPVCAPTRASVLTGRHSLSTGVFSVTRGGEKMALEERTLAEYLKADGYRTGLFGKWHNGLQYPYNPLGQGFDRFYGFADGHITRYFDSVVQDDYGQSSFEGYLPDRLTDELIQFIDNSGDAPFFGMLSFNTPHSPFELPETLFNKYKTKGADDVEAAVYGMMENIDVNIQRVLKHLESSGTLDNTIVVYLSDNGPAFPAGHTRFNGNMKGHKGKVDEGGVRVPFALHWPSRLGSGRVLNVPGQHIDIVPTLLTLTNSQQAPENLHGVDLSPVLLNPHSEHREFASRPIFIHHLRNTRRPDEDAIQLGPGAVRQQGWLATIDHQHNWALFDLNEDPEQRQNLAHAQPDKLDRLAEAYTNWYTNLVAAHGPYSPLPIEIGHTQASTVPLPAHEATIVEEGVIYAHHDGWAHDWLEVTGDGGKVQWPLKVLREGRYQVLAHYSTFGEDTRETLILNIGDQQLQIQGFAPHAPKRDDGTRLFYTSEAPELSWAERSLGVLYLTPKSDKVTLSFGRDLGNGRFALKGLSIKFLED